MNHRVLIDASNLHVGGGVQVAASFVDEVIELRRKHDLIYPWLATIKMEISTKVSESLRGNHNTDSSVRTVDHRPHHVRRWVPRPKPYDAAFIVFGPHYGCLPARRTLVGYADVTSVYAYPRGVPRPPLRRRARQAIRGTASRRLLGRHNAVVTETEAMRHRTLARVPIDAQSVHVVPNAYNSIFDTPEEWGRSLAPPWGGPRPMLVFSYVTRAYPHKNFPFVGQFINALNDQGVTATCLTTLTDDEFDRLDDLTQRNIVNIGPLPLERVPRLYQLTDAALFPSLLEAYSVMPLEAMKMGLPVVASDRDFVHATSADAPLYVDPLDPQGAAIQVAQAFRQGLLTSRRYRGLEVVSALPTARERALAYLRLIDGLL